MGRRKEVMRFRVYRVNILTMLFGLWNILATRCPLWHSRPPIARQLRPLPTVRAPAVSIFDAWCSLFLLLWVRLL